MTDARSPYRVGIRLAIAAFVATNAAAGHAAGPTLAVEDTMHTSVPEVLVTAPRLHLDDILDKVARGEARRDSAMRDQQFTVSFRVLRLDKGPTPLLVEEVVARVYKQKPDNVRGVVLRNWKLKPKKHDDDMGARFTPSMGEEIVNFAFRPEGRRDYTFRIVGRDLIGDQLVYRIAFEPRSALDFASPSGTVWVNTNEYVIVRQEIGWKRSPVPLLVRDLDRFVIERQRVGGHWVLARMFARVGLTLPLPELGRRFDLAWQFDDWAINQGIDPAIFARGGRAASRAERSE